ncbi:GNAT family N-acetyltransferase [Niabella drilacis]|uniref:Acetyltransferase (GNAT) family protein n=1 Tax=Niabella drilacis (strain DSM 25811 / CCM 8410 / CCUG 62505 / LMG 26954 / E90) TaxID=1285928 RepID=A0A1G6XZ36_NIADE|nr:GNAT family N-acetyltransferase [Niabella drilacis]SDD83484.1 Acetyltransferase (GNAT) family protein [Niabella drilacis]
MNSIEFKIVQPDDQLLLQQIAGWYFSEWQIPVDTTVKGLQSITAAAGQFQVLMMLDGLPIATGGIYDHVGLVDRAPRFKIYKKWLAQVYTIPAERGKGYGAALCRYIHEQAGSLGLKKIHLFTDTAASLYRRLGWMETEQFDIANRHLIIMEKNCS